MSRHSREEMERLLEGYLDGTLTDADRAVFEALAASDENVRSELRLQEQISQSLRRMYTPPDLGSVVQRVQSVAADRQAAAPAAPRTNVRRQALAVAALIGLIALAGWRIWDFAASRPVRFDPYGPQEWRSMATVYSDNVREGFEPAWVCEDDEEFAASVKDRLGQPLLLASNLPNVRQIGWAYSNTISKKTMYLIAEVDGTHVLVFVDRAPKGDSYDPKDVGDLNVFHRRIDELVLYELSPMSNERVLQHFYKPSKG